MQFKNVSIVSCQKKFVFLLIFVNNLRWLEANPVQMRLLSISTAVLQRWTRKGTITEVDTRWSHSASNIARNVAPCAKVLLMFLYYNGMSEWIPSNNSVLSLMYSAARWWRLLSFAVGSSSHAATLGSSTSPLNVIPLLCAKTCRQVTQVSVGLPVVSLTTGSIHRILWWTFF